MVIKKRTPPKKTLSLPKKRTSARHSNRCIACGGSGKSSKGHKCIPCGGKGKKK